MSVDMSAKAIAMRLRRVSQLRRLCLSLMKARPIESDQPVPAEPAAESKSAGERRD